MDFTPKNILYTVFTYIYIHVVDVHTNVYVYIYIYIKTTYVGKYI